MENKFRVFTGYFADGVRRIDLVLVLRDDGDANIETITNTFLLNALKIGLEIEMDNGIMKAHRNLIFLKVHAPDSVLQEYAGIFNIQKYFKDNHVDFINAENKFMKYFKVIMPIFFNRHEREWVKSVRDHYPGSKKYSTFERSQIVYRIFHVLPFGNRENFVGLERLLKHKLIIDAYALHDGPYFFLPKQDATTVVNARQILYSNWIGADALLKAQPLSLLQEYFGEKIAYYYAFCELFNRFLLISCGVGIFIVKEAYEELKSESGLFLRRGVKNAFCLNDKYVCPACRDFNLCPFTKTTDHCKEVSFDFMMETPNMIPYYIFNVIWGLFFVFSWKKRENYFSWLWESDCGNTEIPRSGFQINFKKIKRSTITGILTSTESVLEKLLHIIKLLLILATLLLIIFPLTLFWANFQFWVLYEVRQKIKDHYLLKNYENFPGLGVFSVIYVCVNVVLEKIVEIVSHVIVSYENHKTQNSYEKSLIVIQFGATFLFYNSYFVFLAFVKGQSYTYPYDTDNWNSIGGIGMMNCGIFTCIDEICVLLAVIVLFKSIIFSTLSSIFRYATDYRKTRTTNAKVPCWEREYLLNNFDEQFYLNQFKNLALQFSLSLLFVGAFPFAPILVLIGNVLNMRYNSWLLLLGSRRPLLHNNLGTRNWRNVMMIIAFVGTITNVLMITLNTRAAKAEFYEWFGATYNTPWVNFYSSSCEKWDYMHSAIATDFKNYKGFKPRLCIFPGKRQVYRSKNVQLIYGSRAKNSIMQKLVLFQHVGIILVAAVTFLISKESKAVTRTVAIETRIKEQCYYHQMKNEPKLKN